MYEQLTSDPQETQDNHALVTARDYSSFFREEFSAVFQSVKWIVGDDDLSVEITQEAMYRALVHWKKISRYERPGAWVRLVAIRLANRRKFEKHVAVEEAPPVNDDNDQDRVAVVSDVRAAIRSLPVLQRSVVLLYYFYDLPTQEIAETLKKKDAAVRNALTRARDRLKVFLSARGYE